MKVELHYPKSSTDDSRNVINVTQQKWANFLEFPDQ